jgi:hypothetical protein
LRTLGVPWSSIADVSSVVKKKDEGDRPAGGRFQRRTCMAEEDSDADEMVDDMSDEELDAFLTARESEHNTLVTQAKKKRAEITQARAYYNGGGRAR